MNQLLKNTSMGKQTVIYKLIRYILLAVGIAMIAGGIYGLSYVERIDKEYISTVAKIENIQKRTKRSSKRTRAHYDVIVTYTVAGKQYKENLNSYSPNMEIGDNIELKYNPKNPSDIRSVELEYLLFIVLIFVGATLLISYLFAPHLFQKLRK